MYRQALNMFAAFAAVVVATSATLPLCAAEVAADEAREAARGWATLQEALTGKERFSADGVAETAVEFTLPEDAEETTGKLAGLKGEFARTDALSEEFKGCLRPIYRAMNLPENWQSYWQTRSAIASDPVNLSRHLAHRHAALKAFVVDFNRLKGKLPQDFASKLEVLFRQHGIEPNESVKQSHE